MIRDLLKILHHYKNAQRLNIIEHQIAALLQASSAIKSLEKQGVNNHSITGNDLEALQKLKPTWSNKLLLDILSDLFASITSKLSNCFNMLGNDHNPNIRIYHGRTLLMFILDIKNYFYALKYLKRFAVNRELEDPNKMTAYEIAQENNLHQLNTSQSRQILRYIEPLNIRSPLKDLTTEHNSPTSLLKRQRELTLQQPSVKQRLF